MSKGNLFLGFGRGSVGDVTFSHTNGEQIARARNRSPKNPQTPLQLLQRVVMKTTSMGYSLLQDICNHSFQGLAEGTANQSRFAKLNVEKFRQQLADVINSGDADVILSSTETNFGGAGASQAEIMPYIVSEGKIAPIPVIFSDAVVNGGFLIDIDLGTSTPTYQQVIDALGLSAGDQLTFLACSVDDTQDGGVFNGFDFCRVILSPDSGDMSSAFLIGNAINSPNSRNEGAFSYEIYSADSKYRLVFYSRKMARSSSSPVSMCAATVIASRQAGEVWLRSPQSLVIRPDAGSSTRALVQNHHTDFLGDAIYSYMTVRSSSLYLNQSNQIANPNTADSARISTVDVAGSALVEGGSTVVSDARAGYITMTITNALSGANYYMGLLDGSTVYKSVAFEEQTAQMLCATAAQTVGTYTLVLMRDDVVLQEWATIQTIHED